MLHDRISYKLFKPHKQPSKQLQFILYRYECKMSDLWAIAENSCWISSPLFLLKALWPRCQDLLDRTKKYKDVVLWVTGNAHLQHWKICSVKHTSLCLCQRGLRLSDEISRQVHVKSCWKAKAAKEVKRKSMQKETTQTTSTTMNQAWK